MGMGDRGWGLGIGIGMGNSLCFFFQKLEATEHRTSVWDWHDPVPAVLFQLHKISSTKCRRESLQESISRTFKNHPFFQENFLRFRQNNHHHHKCFPQKKSRDPSENLRQLPSGLIPMGEILATSGLISSGSVGDIRLSWHEPCSENSMC